MDNFLFYNNNNNNNNNGYDSYDNESNNTCNNKSNDIDNEIDINFDDFDDFNNFNYLDNSHNLCDFYKFDKSNKSDESNESNESNELDELDELNELDYLNNYEKMVEFDSLNFTKEKKMSLIISSMSELLFKKDEKKHKQILKFLVSKNILDKEVLNEKYDDFRNGLSLLLDSYTKENTLEDYYKDISSNVYRSNYNQIKILGQGSFGTVYKVFHKLERKYYAIKKIFLTKDILDDDLNIINETYLYSQLEHPNIVKYHHSWVSSDFQSIIEFNQINNENDMDKINNVCPVLFIQMELCNFTLDEYFMTQMIDDNLKKRMLYFKDILKGVMYLHKNEIVHRDIKPNNIFFKDNGNDEYIVKIGDLGLCKTKNKKMIMNSDECASNFYKNYTNNILCDDMSVVLMSNHLEQSFHKPSENENVDSYNFDIYSLGIVLIRFLLVCNTDFEKIKTIISLKSNPKNIYNLNNLLSHCYDDLIVNMLSEYPPSLEEIFNQIH